MRAPQGNRIVIDGTVLNEIGLPFAYWEAKDMDDDLATDTTFKKAFTDFYDTCRASINPELSQDAVEEILIQHILTERIFRTVFDRSDFTRRNIIAREIENVSDVLMRQSMSRDEFLGPLNRFYVAIEQAATLCRDFSQKQHFLNTFYEKFFQGFSDDVADTHGIVYTPQSIVDFMVNSVAHILETELEATSRSRFLLPLIRGIGVPFDN